MTEKERILKVLRDEPVDRPPVIFPGGMMAMACREVMVKTGCYWPEVHRDAVKMAVLSAAMHDESGFENVGIPFCMTVEAEAFGGEVEDGDETTTPGMVQYPLDSVSQWKNLKELNPYRDGRLPTILECTRILSEKFPHTPVIGNLVGPLSLATSLIDASLLYKALRQEPEEAHQFLAFLADNSIKYGEALIQNGADSIVISDPSSTGEILGPRLFGEFALPYLNKMVAVFHSLGKPAIVHICGDVSPLYTLLGKLGSKCISVDSLVNIRKLKTEITGKKLMGNVNTLLLQNGPISKIQTVVKNLLNADIAIIAPACGLSATTPVNHLKAMTEVVRNI